MGGSDHGVEDMISLVKLTEEAILENIKIRYTQELIYTYTGSILVSCNPYQTLAIYDTDTVAKYRGARMGSLPPHIFATADSAYRNMREHRANQSVIISGESGAGKSESTKLILQYLAAMTSNHSWVEQQILEANVVLEAFGNAKTVRNNNSSRFGKFIEIHFNEEGHIVGAKIIQYLLEKSRIVYQASSERNYHIFYELCAGASDEEKKNFKLLKPEQYHYLNQSGCIDIEKVNDAESFGDLKIAMTVLGIKEETQESIFRALSAILLLGNVEFKSDGKDGCVVTNSADLANVAELLAVDTAKLTTTLTVRNMKVRGQSLNIPLKPEQAVDTRDALAKGLYGRMFGWLVDSINVSIDISKYDHFIGVLDIFGFENFKVNSFEQLCINYANEKLQQYFNQHIFKLEQEEYTREKVPWDSIPFVDNQECLDLIEKKPLCLLSMLDEECKFPSGSDASWLTKLHQTLEKHKYYVKPRLSRTAFGVNHYAGEVTYETPSFLEKNRDTLYDDLVVLIQGSSVEFIANLFPQDQTSAAKKTVSTQFKEELNNLMKTLSETAPHYVRCIKPNTEKKPNIFDDKLVLDQLRFSGMLDTIRIRQAGFPVRFSFDTFYSRYKLLSAQAMAAPDHRTGCELILKEYGDLMRVGATKVFMKEILEGKLADKRNQRLKEMAVKIQRRYRTFKAYQHYKKLRVSTVVFQKVIRGYFAQSQFERKRAASSKLGVAIVGSLHRKQYIASKKSIAVVQLAIRKLAARNKAARIRNAITKIQATYRMSRQRSAYKQKKAQVTLIESGIRGYLARKHIKVDLDARMKLLAEDESRMPPEEQARRQKLREEEAKKQAILETTLRAQEEAKRQEEEAAKKERDDVERKEREERQRVEKEKRQKEMQELEALEADLKKQNAPVEAPAGDGLSVEDFESTLAELQSFIDGDVFTALGGEEVAPGAAKSVKPSEQVQTVSLAPQPAAPQTQDDGFFDAAMETTEAPTKSKADDCLENYDVEEPEEDDDRPPPLNVYHNHQTFKLEAFAMNHFSPPPKKIKKDTWTKILSFSKKNIAAPLLQQVGKDAALANEALNIFDTIMKFQGEVSQRKLLRKQSPAELAEYIVGKGLEIPDLRDEIYCQLCKQTNNNPKPDAAVRGWELMALTCSAFTPSKMLIKYICNYIQSSIPREGDEGRFATFCLKRLTRTLQKGERRLPPSEVELEAIRNRRTIIIRIHMLDGQAKALDLDASTSTKEVFQNVAEKINLTQTAGFALFEQFDQMERSLKPDEVLGDLLYKWEKNSKASSSLVGGSTTSNQFKIILRRKLFLPPLADPIDPVAKDLIFWQSLNEVVQGRLPCDEKDAVKLAAYHLQGVWGDCDPSKDYVKALSTDVSKYIPKSLVSRHTAEEWKQRILPLHQELKGIDTQFARDMYVQYVKKWPLYGSVVFPVKGMGEFEKRLLSVAINWNGIHILDRTTKSVIYSHDHNQVVVASYTTSKLNVTVELADGSHKQYSFGTPMGVEVDPLMRVYNTFYRTHFKKVVKLDPVLEAAKQREAMEAEKRLDAWATNTEDVEMPPSLELDKYPFKEYAAQHFASNINLTFQRDPLQSSLHNDSSIAKDAALISTLIAAYTWNASTNDKKRLTEAEAVDITKNILEQAIKKPKLRNEIYCQLVRLTTDNPHADNLLRTWQLMAVCCGTFLPTKDLMNFLRAHIQRGHQQTGERNLVMYAAYSNIRLQRTIGFGSRKDVPSGAEITSVLARRPYALRVKTLDGKLKAVAIDPTTTAKDVASKVARKLNLRDFKGFCLYEVVDDNVDEERIVPDAELIGDSMQRFEELEKKGQKNCQVVFKRKIFLNPEEEPADPVLRDLLFHQALHDIVHDRYPLISERDAVKQASFQLQILWGDHDPARDTVKQQLGNETGLLKHIPRRLLPKMKLEQWQHEIGTFYAALQGRSREECKDLYMKYVKKWPLYGDSIFNVKQSARSNLPKELWLAIGRDSVKVLGVAEEVPALTFSFDSIAHYGSSSATFFMVAGNLMNSQKYVFQTKQAADIASVLAIYMAEATAKQKLVKRAG